MLRKLCEKSWKNWHRGPIRNNRPAHPYLTPSFKQSPVTPRTKASMGDLMAMAVMLGSFR